MIEPLSDDLTLALDLAAQAAHIAMPLFERGVQTQYKPDGSTLTEADLAVDAALLTELGKRRPGDCVLTEESGARGQASRRWIIDPIDGTSHFVRGASSWGTHIALEVDGEILLGVVTRPVLGQWWWAARGRGAFKARLGSADPAAPLAVSRTTDPEQAQIMVWAAADHPVVAKLRELGRWVVPTIDGPIQLVEGHVDALYDTLGSPWDIAPAVVLITEAGGKFTDHEGGQRLDSAGRWFSNGHVHDGVMRLSQA